MTEAETSRQEAPLLPARLSPFAPPDPVAERRTSQRLQGMSFAQLRARRNKIDKRLFELGLGVGEPALEIPSVRGTGLVDLDRILRKLDTLDHARDQARMEREVDKESRVLPFDLGWLQDAFLAREIRARRGLLVSELGLALCAADQRVLGEYAPHVKRLLDEHVSTARRIDELFVEMRLVDEEFARRAREGVTDDPPKEIDALLAKALDSVDDVSSKVGGTLANLGKSAAKTATKTAVHGGGQAAVGIAKAVGKGAWALGAKAIDSFSDDDAEDEAGDGPARVELLPAEPRLSPPPRGLPPADAGIPELIRQLARLREDGILTAEEFATKKAELLDRL